MRPCSDGQILEHADVALLGVGKRLLVISPHADDAELGCGGYMHRTAAAGGAVLNVVVAVGDVHFAHLGRVVSQAERIAELDRSMRVLGTDRRVLFTEHDRYLDTMPLADLVTALEVTISGFQPTEVLLPLPSSHQDHEATFRACVAACRPSSLTRCLQLIAANEYSATSWGAGSAADAGRGGAPGRVKGSGCSLHAHSAPATRRQAGRTSPTSRWLRGIVHRSAPAVFCHLAVQRFRLARSIARAASAAICP